MDRRHPENKSGTIIVFHDYVNAFTTESDQVGAVFAIGKRVEGLELFDCHDTLTDMLPKLIRSYAIDALETRGATPKRAKPKRAREFLQRVIDAPVETFVAVGLGTEIRMSASGLIAGGLVADERVVHLAAFSAPVAANEGDGGGFFANFNSRRRRMYRYAIVLTVHRGSPCEPSMDDYWGESKNCALKPVFTLTPLMRQRLRRAA